MADPTQIYVDETDGTDGGTGTAMDPFGNLVYGLNSGLFTAGGTGHVWNIFGSGTLGSTPSLTTYGTPTASAPCIFRGITSTPGDGGRGGYDCIDTYSFLQESGKSYIFVMNLDIANVANTLRAIYLNQYSGVINCSITDAPFTTHCIRITDYGFVGSNTLTNVGGPISVNLGTNVTYNTIVNGPSSGVGISCSSVACMVYRNVIEVSGSANGINPHNAVVASNNTVYGKAGATGSGIITTAAVRVAMVNNNLIQGFNGAGGGGIKLFAGGVIGILSGNAVYDCTTPYSIPDGTLLNGTNATLTASPFRDAAGGDFRILDASGNPVNSEIVGIGRPGKVGLF